MPPQVLSMPLTEAKANSGMFQLAAGPSKRAKIACQSVGMPILSKTLIAKKAEYAEKIFAKNDETRQYDV